MPETIDAVVAALDETIERSIRDRSPAGYFPSLYRRVTLAVERSIDQGEFDDNLRMERFDVVFANRYLDARQSYESSGMASRSWKAAFDQRSNLKLTTLQHLLLGMNAHISLDLGIAAAAVADPNRPLDLKSDFFAINRILGNLIDDTQKRLTRIFGPLGLTDRLLGSIDESFSMFSIGYARDKAWTQTLELLLSDDSERDRLIDERDKAVAGFANCLIFPSKFWIRLILTFARLLERGTVSDRIRILRDDLAEPNLDDGSLMAR